MHVSFNTLTAAGSARCKVEVVAHVYPPLNILASFLTKKPWIRPPAHLGHT